MRIWIAIIISLSLHIAPIMIAMYESDSSSEKSQNEMANFSPPKTIKIQVVAPKPKQKAKIAIKEVTEVAEVSNCSGFYYGLGYGIHINGNWCEVTSISPNSPMDRAGVKVGNLVLVGGGDCPGRGPDGTQVEVTFSKSETDIPTTVTLTREKICTEK